MTKLVKPTTFPSHYSVLVTSPTEDGGAFAMNDGSGDPHQLSLVQKMASACTGAVLVAVLVTPFDVVKTRMQAGITAQTSDHQIQSEIIKLFSSHSSTSHKPPLIHASETYSIPLDRCCHEVARLAQPGSLRTVAADFWLCKLHPGRTMIIPGVCPYEFIDGVRKPVLPVAGNYSGTVDGIMKIARNEGISSLWRGLLPTLFMQVPSTVIYYVGYEMVRDQLAVSLPNSSANVYAPLLSGALARTVAATIISPIELIKTRIQSVTTESSAKSISRQISGMVRTDGVHSLWRGLAPTLWRDVPFSAIYWVGYESIKKKLANEHMVWGNSRFWPAFIAGASAGTIAALVTNPFDVAKTLQQTIHHDEPGCSTKTLTGQSRLGMFNLMRSILKAEGWQGLFRGLSPRIAKIAPACAVMISSYEIGKQFFENQRMGYI